MEKMIDSMRATIRELEMEKVKHEERLDVINGELFLLGQSLAQFGATTNDARKAVPRILQRKPKPNNRDIINGYRTIKSRSNEHVNWWVAHWNSKSKLIETFCDDCHSFRVIDIIGDLVAPCPCVECSCGKHFVRIEKGFKICKWDLPSDDPNKVDDCHGCGKSFDATRMPTHVCKKR